MKPSIIVILAVFLASQASARTWHILNDGSGDAPTIQAGIDSAATGDTVLVGPGSYSENIDFSGKGIAVKSQGGSEVTTLDGRRRADAVVLMANDEVGAILEGFTITGGVGHAPGEAGSGGGLYVRACSPIIRGNRFHGNAARPNGMGGAIHIGGPNLVNCSSSSPLIEDNVFEENSSKNGGAVSVGGGNVSILNNTFLRNTCELDGAGIFVRPDGGEHVVHGNTFYENEAFDQAGGIYAFGQDAISVTITSNLFYKNAAWGTGTGGAGSGGAIWTSSFDGLIANNTIVRNYGYGESVCSGGGIALDATPPGLEIENNIIAFNNSCGITCEDNVESVLGPNLLWGNEDGDLGAGTEVCPPEWSDVVTIADPYFCDFFGEDYAVAQNSPALSGSEPMGAFPDPGCGPAPVKRTTWGRIKTKYGSGP